MTFTAEAGVDYEVVVGAYSDNLPIEYGVTVTIDGVTAPLNQNAATV